MAFIRVTDLDLAGKRVSIRSDLNVPRDSSGNITDDTRVRASLPGIRQALDAGAALGSFVAVLVPGLFARLVRADPYEGPECRAQTPIRPPAGPDPRLPTRRNPPWMSRPSS